MIKYTGCQAKAWRRRKKAAVHAMARDRCVAQAPAVIAGQRAAKRCSAQNAADLARLRRKSHKIYSKLYPAYVRLHLGIVSTAFDIAGFLAKT